MSNVLPGTVSRILPLTSVFIAVSSIDDGVARLIDPHARPKIIRKMNSTGTLRAISKTSFNDFERKWVAMHVPPPYTLARESGHGGDVADERCRARRHDRLPHATARRDRRDLARARR